MEEEAFESSLSQASELRNEIKSIKGQLVGLKKSVTKGDKKAKKEVESKISLLNGRLADLTAKLDQIKEAAANDQAGSAEKIVDLSAIQKQKFLKKQQNLLAKDAQQKAALEAARSDFIQRPRLDILERETIQKKLALANLNVESVPADGDCMFSAISLQLLRIRGDSVSPENLRIMVADHLRKNCEKYAFFVELDDVNDKGISEDPKSIIERYCNRLCDERIWGGHVELESLSTVLGIPIWVYQVTIMNGTVVEDLSQPESFAINRFNDIENATPIRLLYSRYAYSLGEHYDSLY